MYLRLHQFRPSWKPLKPPRFSAAIQSSKAVCAVLIKQFLQWRRFCDEAVMKLP